MEGELSILLVEKRYEVIRQILARTVRGRRPLTLSDLLDRVFLHRALGIPIFLALLWALFKFTFEVSAPLSDLIDLFFTWLGDLAREAIANPRWASLVADGICAGFGSVLVFIPPIFFLFFGLAILEDTGYLARATFVMDRLLYRLGLHGRSFIPLLLGFGCNIASVMAARTIDREEDRILTIVVSPFISCSARLPIYVLIGGAVLGAYAAVAVFSMYVLGIAMAVGTALLLRTVVPSLRRGRGALILELPMYARPTLRSLLAHMYERGVLFVRKAGTIIFGAMLFIWFLATHPWGATSGGQLVENSYAAMIGKALEPLFRPLGFDWHAVVALMLGFIAKEIVVETLGILLGGGGVGLSDAIASSFTPVTGLAFMAFTLLYMPCVATLGTVYGETNSLKWTTFTVFYGLLMAYLVAFLIVAFGSLVT